MTARPGARWKIAGGALLGLAAIGVSLYLGYLGVRTVRAIFLPYNFQLALHLVEVALLVLVGLYVVGTLLDRGGRIATTLRLPDGREVRWRSGLVVGSGAEADVEVPGALVSRRHLLLRREADGTLTATDLESTNGTFREGRDLRGRGNVVLRPGDRLELGRAGPTLEVVSRFSRGRLRGEAGLAALLLFLWSGLYLGWRANAARLPEDPIQLGQVAVDLAAFRGAGPMVGVGAFATAVVWMLIAASRRRPRSATAVFALAAFLVVGVVTLYPLLPASGLRYARAAERALGNVGAERWERLETWERAGGDPERLLDPAAPETELGGPPETASEIPPAPDLELAPDPRRTVIRRYIQGRAALRWATNLGARGDAPLLSATYFRQTAAVLAAVLLALVLPTWLGPLRRALERLPDLLSRPLSRRLVRAADRGRLWALLLRPLAYWDILFGFLAAAVVAVTLWTPLGATLGRGKSLYLNFPGIATVQSVELVKALFVLFMAGYFARHGQVLAKAPRRRYLVPYLLAVLITLALTGVQADLGGLFMLGLFLTLVFIAATGSFRLVAAVPLLVLPGIALTWLLGLDSIIWTRLGIWLSPRTHPLGEQIVQARQLFLSSGLTGYAPIETRAWLLPDVQGDLVIAALAERFGLLGLLALVGCWFAFGFSLLKSARQAGGSGSILLASVAALVLVQVLTQVGGAMGLLPLTGVPLPWISQGLTAALVFTVLTAFAVYAAPASGGVAAAATRTRSVHHLRWIHTAACGALGLAAVAWVLVLPRFEGIGPRGSHYRWQDQRRASDLERWVAAGLFVVEGKRHLRVDHEAYERYIEGEGGGDDPGLLRLLSTVDGLAVVEGQITPRSYLVTNPNRFADRSLPRGWIFAADGAALAMTDRRGRRNYPLGAAAFHPVGYGGGTARALGVEAAAGALLRGRGLGWELRKQAFWHDVHHGPEITLTLRSGLQREAHRLLAGRRGAAVVLDVRDGALLALASSPAPDPASASVDDWLRLSRDADRPLRNRALHSTDAYSPPGSVFKIVVAAAALMNKNLVDPEEKLRCRGYDDELRVSCAHGVVHGPVDLERALTKSCNIYFAHLATKLGVDELRQAATRFGFNRETALQLLPGLPAGVELTAGRSGVLVTAVRLKDRDLARVGYGQGPVSVTPLDVAVMGAAIAGEGTAFEPYLARTLSYSRRGADGRQVAWQEAVGEPRQQRVIPARIARRLNRTLQEVFNKGTARGLLKLWHGPGGWRLAKESPGDGWEGVPMAGKTGSAWKTKNDRTDDSWMVAWAPAEEARVVAAVMVEDAGEGSKVAGPIAVAMLRDALNDLDGVHPEEATE